MDKLDPSYTIGRNVKLCSCPGEQQGGSSKLKIKLSYDLAIPLLGIYPKEMKAETWTDICTPLFVTALLTIGRMWKWPKWPLMNEYTNCGKYIIYMYIHIF